MLNKTVFGGLELHHEVERLGDGVAESVTNLVRLYAERASVSDVPQITLNGHAWQKPWTQIRDFIPVSGISGSTFEEEARGDTYTCLMLCIPDHVPPGWASAPVHPHPQDVEGVIAHEMTHLRWWNLRHGPEFDARTLALLRGAKFPASGEWSKVTLESMQQARMEAKKFWNDVIFRRRVF